MSDRRTRENIAQALTDVSDGGALDINWFGIDTEGAVALLRWISKRYRPVVLQECPAKEEFIPREVPGACAALRAGQTVEGYFEGGPPEISRIQFYSYMEEDHEYRFLELTLSPEDVKLRAGLDPFVALLENAKHECSAARYYVRVENASFDVTWANRASREVIYSSEDAARLSQAH